MSGSLSSHSRVSSTRHTRSSCSSSPATASWASRSRRVWRTTRPTIQCRGRSNKFELSYIWSTARDLLTRRVTMLHKQIYVYPLQLDAMQKRTFLRALIEQTVDVSTHARFYDNAPRSTCTQRTRQGGGSWLALFLGADGLFAPNASTNSS